jgi:putative protease
MAKKKAKTKKAKVKKAKKVKKIQKIKKIIKKAVKKARPAKKIKKEKVLGRIEHYFDKIQVAALSVKAPFKVGDTIHIKGHTTDFNQTIESMQIEHQSVSSVKKGDDVGIKVNDSIYLAEKGKAVIAKPALPQKSQFIQTSIFEAGKVISPKVSKPAAPAPLAQPMPKPEPKPEKKAGDPYQEKKFFSF